MVSKIPALKLELNFNSLPLPRGDLTFGLTIRVAGLNGLDVVTEFSRHNPKQEDNAAFVYRFMPEPAEVYGISIGGTAIQSCVRLGGNRCRRCVTRGGNRGSVCSVWRCLATDSGGFCRQKGQNISPLGVVGSELAEMARDA
ncbi:MAG: hypothetical protein WA133_07135 [Syntrophales bacterium]